MSKIEQIEGMADNYLAIYDTLRKKTEKRPELHKDVASCKDIASTLFIEFNKQAKQTWGARNTVPPKRQDPKPAPKQDVEHPEPTSIEYQQVHIANLMTEAAEQGYMDGAKVLADKMLNGRTSTEALSYDEAKELISQLEVFLSS